MFCQDVGYNKKRLLHAILQYFSYCLIFCISGTIPKMICFEILNRFITLMYECPLGRTRLLQLTSPLLVLLP